MREPRPEQPSLVGRLGARVLRTRRLVRAPVWLFRHRLGVVFGGRLLMLEHTGRRSGRSRYVVLETVVHAGPDAYVVAAGLGTRAQWYRNVRADPRVRVSVGRRHRASARASPVPPREAAQMLATYAGDHPRAWRQLRATVEALGTDPDALPLVRLDLATSPP